MEGFKQPLPAPVLLEISVCDERLQVNLQLGSGTLSFVQRTLRAESNTIVNTFSQRKTPLESETN